jgi:putative oligomerization/nucleic acid binding protein
VVERPSVARMAAARALDLARDPTDAYLVVETEGEALVFGFATSPAELESRCRGVLGSSDASPAPDAGATGPAGSAGVPAEAGAAEPARLLRDLAALHAEGVLSDDEYAEKKAEVLRRM